MIKFLSKWWLIMVMVIITLSVVYFIWKAQQRVDAIDKKLDSPQINKRLRNEKYPWLPGASFSNLTTYI